jgi:hypothetical protein
MPEASLLAAGTGADVRLCFDGGIGRAARQRVVEQVDRRARGSVLAGPVSVHLLDSSSTGATLGPCSRPKEAAVTYAWITTVEARDTADADELRRTLHDEVIPDVSGFPGFQKAYWFAHASKPNAGAVVVLFESEEAARESAPRERGDLGVTERSRDLYRLVAEA